MPPCSECELLIPKATTARVGAGADAVVGDGRRQGPVGRRQGPGGQLADLPLAEQAVTESAGPVFTDTPYHPEPGLPGDAVTEPGLNSR